MKRSRKGQVFIPWTEEEKDFLKTYYGAIRPADFWAILETRSLTAIKEAARAYGIKCNARKYGLVRITYKGRLHEVQGFKMRKDYVEGKVKYYGGTDQLKAAKKREEKAKKTVPKKDRVQLQKKKVDRMEPRTPKKESNAVQTGKIKPFTPPKGKTLTQIEKGIWKYI